MPKGMQPIFRQVATGSTASIVFNNIPQTYTDLRLVVSCKDVSTSATGSYVLGYINDDTGSTSYSRTDIYQSNTDYGTSVITLRGDIGYFAFARTATSNTSYWNANTFTLVTMDFADYTSGKWKPWQMQLSAPSNVSAAYSTKVEAGLFKNNTPIRKISLNQPTNYVAGSTFTLYGIARA